MKDLINQITAKSEIYQEELARFYEKLNTSKEASEQLVYITAILDIYDNFTPLFSFIMINQENIGNIIDGQNQMLSAFKELTGKEYKSYQRE
jgi:hypothetical protein